MKIPWKHILGWGTPIGIIGSVIAYSQPQTEEDIKQAGYKPDIQSQLVCFKEPLKKTLKEFLLPV